MTANYTTNVYTTYADWKAANDAAGANKLVAVGVYRESGKNIFWNVIAA